MFKTLTSAVALFIGGASLAAAATIYSEDFTGQVGQGASGDGVVASTGGWTIDASTAGLFAGSDYLEVTRDERFSFQDTNAGCTSVACNGDGPLPAILPMWLSPEIVTTGFTNLALSLEYFASSAAFEVDGGTNSEDDFIISVLLNGVETVLLDLVQATGTQPSFTAFNESISDTDTLQIKVTGNTYSGSEEFQFDNVVLTGDAVDVAPVPLPMPALLLGSSLLLLVRRRKS